MLQKNAAGRGPLSRLQFGEVGTKIGGRGLRGGKRRELLLRFVWPLGLPYHQDLTFVEQNARALAESQPFRLLGFGQGAGRIITIRNAEMSRAVLRAAIQAPDLDAAIR